MAAFLIRLLLFSIPVFLLFYLAEPRLPARFAFHEFWVIQLFMVVLMAYLYRGLLRAGEKGNQHFVRYFMGTTALKLFLFMIILVGYALMNKETAVAFILHFFVMYLLYTIFEIALIYKRLGLK